MRTSPILLKLLFKALFLLLAVHPLIGQEESSAEQEGGGQSRESAAVDPTAAQWSFQFAYERFYDYKTDTMRGDLPRPAGDNGFIQFRLVAPIAKSEKLPITLLPRLTLRYIENAAGKWGFGSSDLFVLGILDDWGTGRMGIGPQVNFPSQEGFGSKKWGAGFAAAFTQRALNDRLFFALLFQQAWRDGKATSLVINPSFVYQLGKGWYVGNGDFVINYNWQNGGWFVPLGLRFGRAFVQPSSTWNAYIEYASSAAYDTWIGPAASHSIRINVQFQIPVGGGG